MLDKKNNRADFETWYIEKYGQEAGTFNHNEELDNYYSLHVRTCWIAWQAATAHKQKWLPIETAPKDREILILSLENKELYVGQWVKNPYTDDEAFKIADHPEYGQLIVKASHWQEAPDKKDAA